MSLALESKRVVMTGATGGIGTAVAKRLAADGAHLVLVGRHKDQLRESARSLPGGPHEWSVLDVSDEAAWRDAISRMAPDGMLHGLVAAAAVLGPIGRLGSWEVDEFRRTIDVNIVGTLLPIASLIEPLKSTRGSVVAFSGGGATSVLKRYDAYACSKAGLVRLVENMAADLLDDGVRINGIAPGFVVTDIHKRTLEAGPDNVGAEYFERTRKAVESGEGDSPEHAAALTSYLLSDASAGITGRLISARWDPWQDPEFQMRLRDDPHLATLRRIDDQFFVAKASD